MMKPATKLQMIVTILAVTIMLLVHHDLYGIQIHTNEPIEISGYDNRTGLLEQKAHISLNGLLGSTTFRAYSMHQAMTFVTFALTAPLSTERYGNYSKTIRVPEDFKTIQDAVDAACPGDTIEVSSGTYLENIIVDKQLTIRGIGRDNKMPVIDAGDWVSGIVLAADGINLEGFVISNSSLGSGIEIGSNCNLIANNSIVQNSLNGMKFTRDVTGNIVIWNNVTDNGFSGILFEDGAFCNTLACNEIGDNGFSGLSFDGVAKENFVILNNMSFNSFVGLQFKSSASDNIIYGNIARNNSFGGIDFKGYASYNILANNRVIKNTFTGLSLSNLSSNNRLFSNYLLFNLEKDATDGGINNSWDDGSKGNYYSCNGCEDKDNNGICDDPFYIPGGSNVDNYPLSSYAPVFEPPEIEGILSGTTTGL